MELRELMSNNDKHRAEFEHFAKSCFFSTERNEHSEYIQMATFYMWAGFCLFQSEHAEHAQRSLSDLTKNLWNFSNIEQPEIGEYVWVCNKGDSEARFHKWGSGDEAIYSYWKESNRPAPPQ